MVHCECAITGELLLNGVLVYIKKQVVIGKNKINIQNIRILQESVQYISFRKGSKIFLRRND